MSNNQANTDIVPVAKSANLVSSNIPEIAEVLNLSDEIFLESEAGIDYSRLREKLQEQNWLSANNETMNIIIRIVGKKTLFTRDLGSIPLTDFRTMDLLWTKYSDSRFGFSVQQKIYHSERERLKLHKKYVSYEEIQNEFIKIVGWQKNAKDMYDLVLDLSIAPLGHLPWLNYFGCGIDYMMGCIERMMKLDLGHSQ